ncbi:MAG: serine/threonine protein kinase bacterial [bacterium]|nr:MAG: serine/threonine protein kinase bacterial [bacterium]
MKKCAACLKDYPQDTLFCPYDGSRLTDLNENEPYINTILDNKYRIDFKVAEGGMGNVYRATHLHLGIPVAVKIMHTDLLSDINSIERFRREAQATMQIRHTNAIAVLDFGVTNNNTVYLVMEFLEGCTLRRRLREVARFSISDTNWIIQQVCTGVHAAHKRNIIHRDLKPDNIFLQREAGEEIVKVLDFGIAKLKNQIEEQDRMLTRQGMVVGTPHYMSPEQCYGKEVDVRSDIYSLGVIIYELLAGVPPFDADTPIALAMKQATEAPRPIYEINPDIPIDINSIIMHALEKNPDKRPQTVMSLAQELENASNRIYVYMGRSIDSKQIDIEILSVDTPAINNILSNEAYPTPQSFSLQHLPKPNNQSFNKPDQNNQLSKINTNELPNIDLLVNQLPDIVQTMMKDLSGNISELDKTKQKTNKKTTKTYPVNCEICGQEVGRSLVENSTIICPDCRRNSRKMQQAEL